MAGKACELIPVFLYPTGEDHQNNKQVVVALYVLVKFRYLIEKKNSSDGHVFKEIKISTEVTNYCQRIMANSKPWETNRFNYQY